MVCLGNEQRSFCRFWDCTKVPHFRLFSLWYDGHSISSKGFLPTVVDLMVIWVKFAHYAHFSSLIPKMLMFTLAIFCLTASNLLWFMGLTFQVPMKYCSLQHWTLLSSPVTSTTGHCFCFVSASSFLLELFLHFSPIAYWEPTDEEFIFQCQVFLAFHAVHGVLKARILK